MLLEGSSRIGAGDSEMERQLTNFIMHIWKADADSNLYVVQNLDLEQSYRAIMLQLVL